MPGIAADIVDDDGNSVGVPGGGFLVLTRPWPHMARTIWGDDQRYIDTYWSRFPGRYFPGDGAKRDEDGYFWLLGRVDDVMLVSGHNIATMEVESALVSHPAVAEAAVVGEPHRLHGEIPVAFVVAKPDTRPDPARLRDWCKEYLGLHEIPRRVELRDALPRNAAGKILKRELRREGELQRGVGNLE
jgi:acetyl-CoA synthetase